MYQPNNNQWFYEQEKERLAVEQYINNSNRLQNDRYLQCTRINQNIQINMCNPFTIMPRQSARLNYQFPIQQPVQTIQTTSYCEQQPQQEYYHLHQKKQKDINELCKIIYEHIKQTVEELSTKTFLTPEEQEKLIYYKDALDIIHSTQTIRNPNEHILSKLNAVFNLTEIVNKHYSICDI